MSRSPSEVRGGERVERGGCRRAHADEALELALAVVLRQHDRRADRHQQVLVAVVVRVDEQHALRVVEPGHPRDVGDVAHRPVRLLHEELVRQPRAQRHVQVVEAVAVEVPDGDALVPHQIRLAEGVDSPVPVLPSRPQIDVARGLLRQYGVGAVGEHEPVARDLLERLETNRRDLRRSVTALLPTHDPRSRLLDDPRVAELRRRFEPHARDEGRLPGPVHADDLERIARVGARERTPQLFERLKRLTSRGRLARRIQPLHGHPAGEAVPPGGKIVQRGQFRVVGEDLGQRASVVARAQ